MPRVSIVIPSLDSAGLQLDSSLRLQTVDAVVSRIVDHAGGCTAVDGFGAWRNPAGDTMKETVSVLSTYVDAYDGNFWQFLAESVRMVLRQSCVMVSVDDSGKAYFF
jgi:hypothetical protein